MEKQGWVSIWLGNVKDEEFLSDYVDLTYDEDGDSVPSKFYIDFDVDDVYIDEDFIEKMVYDNGSNDISVLLEGCSYDDIIIPKIERVIDLSKSYNAMILIYNLQYDGEIKLSGVFDFIITTEYEV